MDDLIIVEDIFYLILNNYLNCLDQTVVSLTCHALKSYRKIKKGHFIGVCLYYKYKKLVDWAIDRSFSISSSIDPSTLSYLKITKTKPSNNQEWTVTIIGGGGGGGEDGRGDSIILISDPYGYYPKTRNLGAPNGQTRLILGSDSVNSPSNTFFSNSLPSIGTTICGGINNISDGHYSTIQGGENNKVCGLYDTISGGRSNLTSAPYAIANGYGARAYMHGSVAHSVYNTHSQKISIHIQLYGDEFRLKDESYPYLRTDSTALVKVSLIGIEGSSAIFQFVIRRFAGQYEILRFNQEEMICTDDKHQYLPIVKKNGFTIKIINKQEIMIGTMKLLII